MRIRVFVIGKPRLAYAAAGVAEYLPRLRRFGPAEVVPLRAAAAAPAAPWMRLPKSALKVLVDGRGRELTSAGFAAELGRWLVAGHAEIAFLIGGADGHGAAERAAADYTMALGKLTLQHELALVVLLEQLYRARTILAGGPYHR